MCETPPGCTPWTDAGASRTIDDGWIDGCFRHGFVYQYPLDRDVCESHSATASSPGLIFCFLRKTFL